MPEEKTRPCEDMKKVQDIIERGRQRLHEGDIIMAEIKLTLKTISEKVDALDVKVDKKFEKLTSEMEELKMKPAKKWDGLMSLITALLVGALFGAFFTAIGL
jgi:hypothetical protein